MSLVAAYIGSPRQSQVRFLFSLKVLCQWLQLSFCYCFVLASGNDPETPDDSYFGVMVMGWGFEEHLTGSHLLASARILTVP